MRRIGITAAFLCGLGLAGTAVSAAHAATVDTYDFTVTSCGGVVPTVLTGSFTGFVEPGGIH